MKRTLFLITCILISLVSNAQIIDSKNSIVNFAISNMKWKTIEGTFSGMDGEIEFNENDLQNSSFNVCIKAATVNTEKEKRDVHLRNEDFFEVAKYPNICFASSSIEKTTDGYLTKGKLSMHGITKPIEINFTYKNNAFNGKLTVNRFDYKVGENMKTFMVGETVTIEIICTTN